MIGCVLCLINQGSSRRYPSMAYHSNVKRNDYRLMNPTWCTRLNCDYISLLPFCILSYIHHCGIWKKIYSYLSFDLVLSKRATCQQSDAEVQKYKAQNIHNVSQSDKGITGACVTVKWQIDCFVCLTAYQFHMGV